MQKRVGSETCLISLGKRGVSERGTENKNPLRDLKKEMEDGVILLLGWYKEVVSSEIRNTLCVISDNVNI